jgi:hypothetical protein
MIKLDPEYQQQVEAVAGELSVVQSELDGHSLVRNMLQASTPTIELDQRVAVLKIQESVLRHELDKLTRNPILMKEQPS